ncbi:N-acetylglucosamine-phosphate mutase [Hortaea werneckii]|nr:N-acetylglucosamine-phosphate mutase [Hortaea werneckii]
MSDPEGKYEKAVADGFNKWPRADTQGKPFTYGTAGFRMRADLLDYIMYSVGVLAGLRSRKQASNTIGVMITASHNKAEDNGVKLVDQQGEMLEQDWEPWATEFANAMNGEELKSVYMQLVDKCKVDQRKEAHVIFARDTRPSGDRLVKALKDGLDAVGVQYTDYGCATTPQLHYLVRATNTQNQPQPYGEVSIEGYYKKMAAAFAQATKYSSPKGPVTVDCANGVGAPKLKELMQHMPQDKLQINIVNDRIDKAELLNERAGADFVKTQQRGPQEFVDTAKAFDRWCSLDGDADRIVYYFNADGSQFRLLDGDRIATLAASFIGDLVRKAGLEDAISLAVVQTAYANGASTRYIESNLGLKVEVTPTGVKHLHHVASRYDIGVYFEANGHGTVLFNPRALKAIRKHEPQSPAQLEALETLKALADLINQTVGDALSDLLLVEAILAYKDWTVAEWLATYTDLPNKLAKVLVRDRSEYRTVLGTAERKLESPEGLQARIEEVVRKYKDGRCFVRASGTEDAVRVYGEAAEVYDVEDMVAKVVELINAQT